jgi:glycosyltransferase involved in cell wall biosynthesis
MSTAPAPATASRISIVLPIYNQAGHIGEIVRGYATDLDAHALDYELILVANGCRDDSVAVCERLAAELPRVTVLAIEGRGWGRAVKAGLRAATGDTLCYTNSARTTPQILTLLLIYARAYPEAVIKANRRTRDSLRRRLGSLVYNLECRALFDLSVWDINGTPKVFPRSFDRLLTLSSDDDLIDAEFNAVCRDAGYAVLEVPILATTRHGGKSTTNYRSAVNMYYGVWRLAQRLGFRP